MTVLLGESLLDAQLRIGVIGLGQRGLFHLERWIGDAAVTAVACDPDPTARAVAAGFCERVVAEPQFLLAEPQLDAVLLAVPAAQRAVLGQQVLASGRHLLLDPPLAATVPEAQALLTAARKAGRQILLLHSGTNDVETATARAVVQSGQLGPLRRVRRVHWTSGVAGGWEQPLPDGPPIPRMLVALLDDLLSIVDCPAQRLVACPHGHYAGLTVLIEFPDSLTGMIELATDAAVPSQIGWTIDAERGGYSAGRRWVRTLDGEVYDVPADAVAAPPAIETRLRETLADDRPPTLPVAAVRLVAVLAAVAVSLRDGTPVPVEPVPVDVV